MAMGGLRQSTKMVVRFVLGWRRASKRGVLETLSRRGRYCHPGGAKLGTQHTRRRGWSRHQIAGDATFFSGGVVRDNLLQSPQHCSLGMLSMTIGNFPHNAHVRGKLPLYCCCVAAVTMVFTLRLRPKTFATHLSTSTAYFSTSATHFSVWCFLGN